METTFNSESVHVYHHLFIYFYVITQRANNKMESSNNTHCTIKIKVQQQYSIEIYILFIIKQKLKYITQKQPRKTCVK